MTEDELLRRSIEHLHGPEEVPYGEDELIVVCLVRDGRPYIKSYHLEHNSQRRDIGTVRMARGESAWRRFQELGQTLSLQTSKNRPAHY